MRIIISLSTVARRRARKAALDNVDGNRIKVNGPKIVRRYKGEDVTKGAALVDQELAGEEQDLEATKDVGAQTDESEIDSVHVSTPKDKKLMSKLKVSVSGDVIFTPYTDGTQYACRRDALANLRRRMPGFDIMLSDVTGEGQIDFTAAITLNLEGKEVSLTARGIASPYEMAVHTITVNQDDNTLDINPVDRARSPEDTVNFLKRVALNCLNGKYSK